MFPCICDESIYLIGDDLWDKPSRSRDTQLFEGGACGMNNRTQTKSRAVRTRKKVRRYIHKHSGGVRIVAVFLATVMAFSALSANVSSIVRLLDVSAADNGEEANQQYYFADLTLYDYYSDNELKNNGINTYTTIFNDVLYYSGYTGNAGTWGSLKYYPLYLGKDSANAANDKSKYKFSPPANGEAGTQNYIYDRTVNGENFDKPDPSNGHSAAAQGLIDSTLSNGVITQGNGTVTLPYFDEEFITTPIRKMVLPSAVGLTNSQASSPLGEVRDGLHFKFRYNSTTKLYEYNSKENGLKLATDTGDTLVVQQNVNASNGVLDEKYYPGFFPLAYIKSGGTENHNHH